MAQGRVTHCIIFEPDLSCRQTLESALASIYWTVAFVESLSDIFLPTNAPWAFLLAVESGDLGAVESIRDIRANGTDVVICVLVDEISPDFDRQVTEAGADSVFAKPVQEKEIVEALVSGFLSRRR
ncbi:MAG: hypothetical protein ABL956_04140 [Hyphomonadaceae bacterium]